EFTTSGLVNGDSVSSVSLSSTGAGASATVAGSPYQVTINNAQGSGLTNYTISYVNGTLTVNSESTSITVGTGSVQYSDLLTLQATLNTGTLAGQTLTGKVDFYINGSSTSAASATVSSTSIPLTVTATTGQILLGPASYAVTAVFTSTNSNFSGNQ